MWLQMMQIAIQIATSSEVRELIKDMVYNASLLDIKGDDKKELVLRQAKDMRSNPDHPFRKIGKDLLDIAISVIIAVFVSQQKKV